LLDNIRLRAYCAYAAISLCREIQGRCGHYYIRADKEDENKDKEDGAEDGSISIQGMAGVDAVSFELAMIVAADDDKAYESDEEEGSRDISHALLWIKEFTRINPGSWGFEPLSPEVLSERRQRLENRFRTIITNSQIFVRKMFSDRTPFIKWPLNPKFMGRLARKFLPFASTLLQLY
jgi:hypothetical protein